MTLVIIIVFLVVSTIVNLVDYKIPYLNPPEPENTKYIRLYYPSGYSNTIPGTGNSSEENTPLLYSANIMLKYKGDLSEGEPVDVYASGYVYPKGQNLTINVMDPSTSAVTKRALAIGFEGASLYDTAQTQLNPGGVFLIPLEEASSPVVEFPDNSDVFARTITWSTEGDYYPYTILPTPSDPINSPFTDFKIHVASSQSIRQERYIWVTTWLTVVLVFFTVIQILPLSLDLYAKLIVRESDENLSDAGKEFSDGAHQEPGDHPPPAGKNQEDPTGHSEEKG